MKKLLIICAATGLVASAMALATFTKPFADKYGVKPGSTLAKAACGVCHTSAKGGKLNGYGKDLSAAMKAANSKKLTPAVLTAVEGKDSDGDGKKNIDEIKADSNPGA